MKVEVYKTRKILPGSGTLLEVIDEYLPEVKENSVVVIASKIVATCEGSVVPINSVDIDDLIEEYSQYYLPRSLSRYKVSFTITKSRLVVGAGIDESNAGENYILWPKDAQASANEVRAHLMQKYGIKNVGVILSDSMTRPLQWGTTGVALSYSGFEPIYSYIGKPDLFGREFVYHTNSIVNGLAAAATMVMGEGAEQTPLAIVEDVPFVTFQDHDPTDEELAIQNIPIEDDVYAPMLNNAPWSKGRGR